MKPIHIIYYILLLTAFSSSGTAGDDIVINGQGGTGLQINNIRNFDITQATIIKEDGIIIPAIRGQGGTGFKVRYSIANDVNADITAGTLNEVNLINTHKGPVTSVDPLIIFNVDSLVTADTFYEDGLVLENIQVGDELKVSGFIDDNSSIIISRIEADDAPLAEWKLSGYISNLNMNTFNINNQLVEIGSAVIDNCLSGLQNGGFVEIKATPDNAFTAGSTLGGVTQIECVDAGIVIDPGLFIPVALEGLVDFEDIDLNSLFTVAGQLIFIDMNTLYINGEIDDIVVGAKVEVEGLLNSSTSEITANKVKFKEVRFKFEEPVLPGDVVIGTSIQLFGKNILNTPQLRDEDGIMTSGLAAETQVEVRGYADSQGNLYATRVRERGNPDANDVSADGQITAISNPFIEVYGVVVDTTNSVFFDQNNMVISAVEFFAQIAVGTEVEVESSSVNEMNNVIDGVIVRIDEADDVTRIQQRLGFAEGQGIGTITGFNDLIFADSFE